jgi:hypothetical protein
MGFQVWYQHINVCPLLSTQTGPISDKRSPIDFSDLMGYDVEHMQESLDFFNAMAYDLHGINTLLLFSRREY